MKTYGLTDRSLRGCCPGHDKFPRESYNNRRSKRRNRLTTKIMRRRQRRIDRRAAKAS